MERLKTAVIFILVAGVAALFWYNFTISEKPVCEEGDVAKQSCISDSLVFEHCEGGKWVNGSVNCQSLTAGGVFFRCDPAAVEVEGAEQAGCINVNVRKEGAGATPQPACGDRICTTVGDYKEDCVSCPLDCFCGRGFACSATTRKCVSTGGQAGGGIPVSLGSGSGGLGVLPFVRATCGDGACIRGADYDENCETCPADCKCGAGKTCAYGACVSTCGNGKCDASETNCCKDCGCSGTQVCDRGIDKCFTPLRMNETQILAAVASVLTPMNLSLGDYNYTISDIYVDGKAVKRVTLGCPPVDGIVCEKIVDVYANRTELWLPN